MSKQTVAPFLIAKDGEGQFRITIRNTLQFPKLSNSNRELAARDL
jgi:hypothetical protein